MNNKKGRSLKRPAPKNSRRNVTTGGGNRAGKPSQLRRIAEYFLRFKTATTPELAEQCSAIHPPRRICDLRQDFGWRIQTLRQNHIDAQGRSHWVGKYVLLKVGVMP